MNSEQTDRLIAAASTFAGAFEQAVQLAQAWFDKTYPAEVQYQAEVFTVGETPKEPQSIAEYQALPDDGPGRFSQLIDAAKRAHSKA